MAQADYSLCGAHVGEEHKITERAKRRGEKGNEGRGQKERREEWSKGK